MTPWFQYKQAIKAENIITPHWRVVKLWTQSNSV